MAGINDIVIVKGEVNSCKSIGSFCKKQISKCYFYKSYCKKFEMTKFKKEKGDSKNENVNEVKIVNKIEELSENVIQGEIKNNIDNNTVNEVENVTIYEINDDTVEVNDNDDTLEVNINDNDDTLEVNINDNKSEVNDSEFEFENISNDMIEDDSGDMTKDANEWIIT